MGLKADNVDSTFNVPKAYRIEKIALPIIVEGEQGLEYSIRLVFRISCKRTVTEFFTRLVLRCDTRRRKRNRLCFRKNDPLPANAYHAGYSKSACAVVKRANCCVESQFQIQVATPRPNPI